MSKANIKNMIEMARGHVEQGGIRAAEVYYRMVLKAAEPLTTAVDRLAAGEAYAFFAARKVAEGMHGAACDLYQRAVAADPLFVEYRLNFIIRALLPMNMFKNAKIEAERATRIEPNNPDAWRALAICCAALNEEQEAADAYDKQVELDAGNPLAHIDRATLAINVGDYYTAHKHASLAMRDKPHGDAMHILALIAYRDGQHERAIDLYEKTLLNNPQDPEQVLWNKSLACHAIGRYREGWELAEARGRQKADAPMRLVMNRFDRPSLTRETLRQPCKLHVHHEMGNGDAIAMARYLPLLVGLGHDVTLETMDSMVTLFQRSFPQVKVVPRAIDYPGAIGIEPFDKHVTTLSLPYIFETDIDTVPWDGPYLKPDRKAKVNLPLDSCRNIGLCWSSGIRTDGLWISRYGKAKSMAFSDLGPIFNVRDRFVSLQVGPERAQNDGTAVDVLSKKPSWDETAALVDSLDLVITVDTAVAHLAGALGRPTILLMQKDGATWHFMAERPGAVWNDRSPWYPSMKIIRQKQPGNWADVVQRAALELNSISAAAAE